ncbi:RHS repeat domain-containing protein [Flavobacteriaceae bacterium M23B6Z8]
MAVFSERARWRAWERLSYQDSDGNGSITQSEIREENNYHPFGLKHKGYNQYQGAARDHRFEYNDKEYEEGIKMNLVEMDFRQYDAVLARFNGMDRLADFAPSITPFRFAFNNPIVFKDPTGLFEKTSNGETIGADGLTTNQWINVSNPTNPDRGAAKQYHQENRQKKIERNK